MAIASPLARRHTVAALLGLTFVTGLVDAVSYLRLGHVFVANMTGNVVFIAFGLHPHSGVSPVASLVAIGSFALGALAGGRGATHLAHRRRQWLTAAFAVEAAVLAIAATLIGLGVLPLDGDGRYWTVAVLSVALGVQNSTVRHLGVPDLTTTVLTLTITGLTADSAMAGGSGARPHRRLGTVLTMLAGAGVGALLLDTSVTAVIGIAAGLVVLVAIYFLGGPASPVGAAPAAAASVPASPVGAGSASAISVPAAPVGTWAEGRSPAGL
jgi:uncharacterized membrane protein YoaK (UPF0700 family)